MYPALYQVRRLADGPKKLLVSIGRTLSASGWVLLAACTPEAILDYRERLNPGDPIFEDRPLAPLVTPRRQGSNYPPRPVATGLDLTSVTSSWDGRLYIGYNDSYFPGWHVQLLRPGWLERHDDGSPRFNDAFTPLSYSSRLLAEPGTGAGVTAGRLRSMAVTPHPRPDNAGFAVHPLFQYDIFSNPFSSDENGHYSPDGAYQTYELRLYSTDDAVPARLVALDLRLVIAQPGSLDARLHHFEFRQPASLLGTGAKGQGGQVTPLLGADPALTFDGRLMIFERDGELRYSVNPTPERLDGWSAPRGLADMFYLERKTRVGGQPLLLRYPIASAALRDHLGRPYPRGEPILGGKPWLSHDGTDLLYLAGPAEEGTPSVPSLLGRSTAYQSVSVGPLVHPQPGRGDADTTPGITSLGAVPGFWYPFTAQLQNADFPLPYTTLKPVLPLLLGDGKGYAEFLLEDALDGRYLLLLRMSESVPGDGQADSRITPDTSGNLAHGSLLQGAVFPWQADILDPELEAELGQAIVFRAGSFIEIENGDSLDRLERAMSIELAIRPLQMLDRLNNLVAREGAFALAIVGSNRLVGSVTVTDGRDAMTVSSDRFELLLPEDRFTHVAMTAGIEVTGERQGAKRDTASVLRLRLYLDGEQVGEKTVVLGNAEFRLVDSEEPIIIGPESAGGVYEYYLCIDDVKLSYIERDQFHIRESAYRNHRVVGKYQGEDSEEEIALGKRLFSDPILSAGVERLSCSSCHDPERAFTDGRSTPLSHGRRNTPTLIGRRDSGRQFLDGRAPDLEALVLETLFEEEGMGHDPASLELALRNHAGYAPAFLEVYGREPATDLVARALAAYVRSIPVPETLWDDVVANGPSVLTTRQRRGMNLFFSKARCSACHNGEYFTDELFHNTGFVNLLRSVDLDLGRAGGRFKTPTLRSIADTAPYLHDGSVETLEEMVDLYNQGGIPVVGGADVEVRKLGLTAEERRALVAFLRIL